MGHGVIDLVDEEDAEPAKIICERCPFCGSTDLYLVEYDEQPKNRSCWIVECEACEAQGPRADVPLEAQRKWNERVQPWAKNRHN